MKLLAFTEHVAPPGLGGGGAESILRDLTEALTRRGHTVQWLQDANIERAVNDFQPDVVHVQTIHNRFGMAPARWLQDNHIPHVWVMMDYWPICLGRTLLRQGDEPCSAVKGICDGNCSSGRAPAEYAATVNRSPVVALNQYTADIYRRNGIRTDYVVEMGVDTNWFTPDYSQRPNSVAICASSAWSTLPHKGMHILDKAVTGYYTVDLITGVPREEVARRLRRAHLYVFPSTYEETYGLSLTEAMASGCAVIASDVAGPRAQIHEGMGVLVPPRDPIAIREALDWLTRDHTAREAMGALARGHVITEHSLSAMGKRWEAVYQAVVNTNPAQ